MPRNENKELLIKLITQNQKQADHYASKGMDQTAAIFRARVWIFKHRLTFC